MINISALCDFASMPVKDAFCLVSWVLSIDITIFFNGLLMLIPPRIVITGHLHADTIRLALLPIQNFSKPEAPCVPQTTMKALLVFASEGISV